MSEHYIRILFYKTPKFKWKYLINWLISIRTLSKYSHCEIWVADQDFFVNPYSCGIQVVGTCYTSTMRGKDNGTVKRGASGVLDHPERWDYIEIPLTDAQYEALITWMDFEVANNAGYSRWDIMRFILPIHFNDTKRNICSEFVNNALCRISLVSGFGIVSPSKVCKKLKKLGHKTKELK